MSRKSVEISIQIRYIDGQMRYGLCAINQHFHTMSVRHRHNFFHGIDGAKHIRYMRH